MARIAQHPNASMLISRTSTWCYGVELLSINTLAYEECIDIKDNDFVVQGTAIYFLLI